MAAFTTLFLTLASHLVTANPLNLNTRQAPCAAGVHMVVAGGNGTIDNTGLLQPLIDNTASRYPGSDSWLTPYDGSQNPTGFATQQMTAHVMQYHTQCPQTPIALFGYSLGGVVVANTVCGGVPFPSNIIAAVAYGDETRVAGQSYNRGTCATSSPTYPRPFPQKCQAFASRIVDYCDSPDPQCCEGGTDGQVHFEYANKYDPEVQGFIAAQHGSYMQFMGAHG